MAKQIKGLRMKKMILIGLMIAALMFSGCGDTISAQGDTVSVDCGEGGCGDITVGDGNTLHDGEDSTGVTPSVAFDLDNFDKDLKQGECNDLGFFFCTLANECLPQPLTSGTCPNK